uniref:Sulfhydryl oxidase n=1 Tax=Physcomitrium patens TaxID=3218 RepID=A0A7I4F9J7_PHYPA
MYKIDRYSYVIGLMGAWIWIPEKKRVRGRKMAGERNWASMWVAALLLVGGVGSVLGNEDDCAVELYDKIFHPSLAQTNTPYALVEFFASWLPECQQFKPHYERVACLFNDPTGIHEGEVYVTMVNCALESNKGLCERFDIQSYPTLYWGPPRVFASGDGGFKQTLGLESVAGATVSSAESLLEWINTRIKKKYSLNDVRPGTPNTETEISKQEFSEELGIWEIPGMLHDVEEATAYAFSYMLDEKMLRSSSHSSFLDFLHLLEMHHPSHRCRIGSAKLLQDSTKWWPASQFQPTNALRKQQLCGPGIPRRFWKACDGKGRGYRTHQTAGQSIVVRTKQFLAVTCHFKHKAHLKALRWLPSHLSNFSLCSCGLWLLLHSLTVRVQEFEATFAKLAIEAFVDDFYKCDHCRDHFRNATTRSQASSQISKRDLVLWLWRIHNMITEVVASEEHKTEGNSSKLWPAENDCPACRDKTSSLTFDWDEEAVYYYLMDFYGPSPQNPGNGMKVRSAYDSRPVAPYWAAVGIAVVGSGFACATYYYLRTFSLRSKYLLT